MDIDNFGNHILQINVRPNPDGSGTQVALLTWADRLVRRAPEDERNAARKAQGAETESFHQPPQLRRNEAMITPTHLLDVMQSLTADEIRNILAWRDYQIETYWDGVSFLGVVACFYVCCVKYSYGDLGDALEDPEVEPLIRAALALTVQPL